MSKFKDMTKEEIDAYMREKLEKKKTPPKFMAQKGEMTIKMPKRK